MKRRLIGSFVMMIALTACQTLIPNSPVRPLAMLSGTQWLLTHPDGIDQTISFGTNGQVSGSSGCNNFSGSFMQTGRMVTFGPLASTRRACQEPLQSAEARFFNLLADTRAADATMNELVFFGDRGEVLAVLIRNG